jgi:hypothetical protein
MKSFLTRLPSPAMVVACTALVVSMGGAGYAATALPKNSVGTAQLKKASVNGDKVKDGSLVAADFKRGQLPAGPPGPKGDTGTVDTSQFFNKSASDARYLAAGAKAADADKLDGLDSTQLLRLATGVSGDVGVISAFVHTATAANKLSANGTDVDNPAINGNPNALVYVTQLLNPSGIVYNNSPVGVYYNTVRKHWEIFNQNNAAIPTNAQFMVLALRAH